MKYIVYIIYRFYKRNSKSSTTDAYYGTIFAFLALLGISILTILYAFKVDYLPHIFNREERWKKYLIIFICYIIPGYILTTLFVKRKDVENQKFESSYKKKHGLYLSIYIALIFIFAIVTSIDRKG